jgi:hypothetical protein
MTQTHRTTSDSRIERLFMSVNVASVVAIGLFSIFFIGYMITHEEIIEEIQTALSSWDFIALQAAFEHMTEGILGAEGWIRATIGLGLLLLSVIFILNVGGIIFGVFIHRPFTAGGTPTISWWRMSFSRFFLTVRLLFFISLYKITGVAGFEIMQEYFDSPVLNIGFFLSGALSLGTLIVLASVIKIVVYEVGRYETLVESNRTKIAKSLQEYLDRFRNEMILLDEALLSESNGYMKAKLEDATRNMRSDVRLLERSKSDLAQIASPRGIIRKLLTAFIGVVLIQLVTDIILYIGWGTVLEFITGGFLR